MSSLDISSPGNQGPIDDVRIVGEQRIEPPEVLREEIPVEELHYRTVTSHRQQLVDVLEGRDARLVVVCGPCSIHDPDAALEFGAKLAEEAQRHRQNLLVVMRSYFEKPRTRVGWKGLINDPDLDGSYNVGLGLRRARGFLRDVAALGLGAGTELLDLITPQYLADLISWGCIGARTCESQLHRELASGMSCPVGFKNPTSGDVRKAVDAVMASRKQHIFLGVARDTGGASVYTSEGNASCHVVLRGGTEPNYGREHIEATAAMLADAGVSAGVMVDASHSNSGKDFRNQPKVVDDLARQVREGQPHLLGVMMESFLVEGNQSIDARPLRRGCSITDACMGWEMTRRCLDRLSEAVAASDRASALRPVQLHLSGSGKGG